ncbi:MAG: carboxypeptidase-like regulatory domain-containing protein [Oscillatoriaceae cyanobacterium Prado104]|jgi:hypothetical protein|nr:carboxypeptidase-like regulatory domain-containing protein [Oscillatoriaceae cyanobacterium Prado104]
MKGDFSRWYFNQKDNFAGVLQQQGKVLLDSDWNAQTQIINDWQETAGQDIIGAGVAAVPAGAPDAFKVTQALLGSSSVQLTLFPGRIWADGLLVNLEVDKNATGKPIVDANDQPIAKRTATYLQLPIQEPPENLIRRQIRDAVILEVWQEAINGFQLPEILIEPALGGPDTTERIQTSTAFKLYRLAPDETCENIRTKLQDDFANKGKLTVSLQPTAVTKGDCPVVKDGGYTGFEHYLYRIEIARVDSSTPSFKWSQFNGGLVGRGEFKPAAGDEPTKVLITANFQAITTSGSIEFYLEAIEYDANFGHWRVIYGAKATLNSDNELILNATTLFGTFPAASDPPKTTFFRLWNGIEEISQFPMGTSKELRDGIRLEFENPSPGKYVPGDYWTFKVRAGEIDNPPFLLQEQPPDGIHYHRVPVAELNWNRNQTITFNAGEIEDCRKPFRPLINQKGCCSFTVGDGKSSYGDFNSIADAIRHLPNSGGKICLLPGLHEANVLIQNKRNIKIEGCGKQTRVIPQKNDRESPIFQIVDSECIALLDMDLVTLGGRAIELEATEIGRLKEIEIGRNRIIACQEAIHVKQGVEINIHHNKIRMLDKQGAGVGIYLMAEDSLIERNDIGVIPAEQTPPRDTPNGENTPDPTDPCANLEIVYHNIPVFVGYINWIWSIPLLLFLTNPYQALGGIQIAGGSERVKVWENTINGGAGNGIALGTSLAAFLEQLAESPEEKEQIIEHTRGGIEGFVKLEETGLANITVLFEPIDLSPATKTKNVTTNADGFFSIAELEAGNYRVDIATPGYKIDGITFSGDNRQGFRYLQIDVVQEEIDFGNLLAFIYDIEIDRNEISRMELSGIGLPRVELPNSLPKTVAQQVKTFAGLLAIFGNPVIGLEIRENHIFNCFQTPINQALRDEVKVRGFGGISLGMCANLAIDRNRIESNGTSHINPVCGIFVTYGEQMDITHNWIAENGPLTNTTDLVRGRRGGIVLGASSFPLLSLLSTISNTAKSTASIANQSALIGRSAARVHDNIVSQPAGQALTIGAIGPVSITNNHFHSEVSGTEFFDLLAGSVLIVNFGGLNRLGTPGLAGTVSSTEAIYGKAFRSEKKAQFTRNPDTELLFPNGNTLFNSNQTRSGSQNTSLTSQWIFSTDDIGFDGNQSDCLGGFPLKERILAVNTVLWATTLRATDSRFKEILDLGQETSVRTSLITLSILMNNTTNNQGDHCIFTLNTNPVATPPLVTEGNQILDTKWCPLQV